MKQFLGIGKYLASVVFVSMASYLTAFAQSSCPSITISGPAKVCVLSVTNYSAAGGDEPYAWSLTDPLPTGSSISVGSPTTTATLTAGSNPGSLTINVTDDHDCPGNKQVDVIAIHVNSIVFGKHDSLSSVTDATIDGWCSDGSSALQTKNFDIDEVCCAGFQRNGAIVDGDQYLDIDDANMPAAFLYFAGTLNVNVYVVHSVSIMVAGATSPEYAGWGSSFGAVIAEPYGSGLVLAHEWGHVQGLPHNSDSRYIMYPSLPAGRGVTSTECGSF